MSSSFPRKFSSILNPFKEGGSEPTLTQAMAQSAISDFSAPSAAHVAMGPQVNLGDVQFELMPTLINMVQANPFCGKPHEDANAHLQHFMEVCGTIAIKLGRHIRHCLSSPFPVLLAREGEAMVLCSSRRCYHLGKLC